MVQSQLGMVVSTHAVRKHKHVDHGPGWLGYKRKTLSPKQLKAGKVWGHG
jgi:hypothetical protein